MLLIHIKVRQTQLLLYTNNVLGGVVILSHFGLVEKGVGCYTKCSKCYRHTYLNTVKRHVYRYKY